MLVVLIGTLERLFMLRKDVKYMLEKDWEPVVPPTSIIRDQSAKFRGRLSGSVRLAEGLVSTGERSLRRINGRIHKSGKTR